MADPTCQVKDGAGSYVSTLNGVNVTSGNVITIKLANTTDVKTWVIVPIGADDLTDLTTIVPTVDIVTKTATFTAPAGARAMIFQSTVVNGLGVSSITTIGVYILTGNGSRLIASNETTEGNAKYGWIAAQNAILRNPGSFPSFTSAAFGIGSAPTAGNQLYVTGAGGVTFARTPSASGTPIGFVYTGAAHTGVTTATELTDVDVNLQRTVTWAAGTIPVQRFMRIRPPTIAFASASTVTRAATFAIDGQPAAGANATLTFAWALWVLSGITRFDGRVEINTGVEAMRILKNAADSNGPLIRFVKSRGTTEDAPAGIVSSDEMGGIAVTGVDSSLVPTTATSGSMSFYADDTFTSTTKGTRVSLQLTPPGTVTKAEVLGIDGRGVHRQVQATVAPTANPSNALSFYVDPTNQLPQWRRPSGEVVIVDSIDPSPAGHRLTSTTGGAIPSDVTTISTIFLTPFAHGTIMLFDGSLWRVRITAEISLALTGLTAGKNYDVFAYWTGTAVALELSAAWTSDSLRADGLLSLGGVRVKSSNTTRRLVGTIRATAANACTDTVAQRFLVNENNLVRRAAFVTDPTASWTYASTAFRQVRATTTNRVELLVCGTSQVEASSTLLATAGASGIRPIAGVGIDSTTVNSGTSFGDASSSAFATETNQSKSDYDGVILAGYHTVNWLEAVGTASSITIYGTSGGSTASLRARLRI